MIRNRVEMTQLARSWRDCVPSARFFEIRARYSFKKHKGLRSALNRDLVRNGLSDMQWGKFFDDVFESRQRGDYTPMITFVTAGSKSTDPALRKLEIGVTWQ